MIAPESARPVPPAEMIAVAPLPMPRAAAEPPLDTSNTPPDTIELIVVPPLSTTWVPPVRVTLTAEPKSSCVPPEIPAPTSTPWALTISLPPLRTGAGSAVPPEETMTVPPLSTVASAALPSDSTMSVPPLSTIPSAALPPAETISVPPLPTDRAGRSAAGGDDFGTALGNGGAAVDAAIRQCQTPATAHGTAAVSAAGQHLHRIARGYGVAAEDFGGTESQDRTGVARRVGRRCLPLLSTSSKVPPLDTTTPLPTEPPESITSVAPAWTCEPESKSAPLTSVRVPPDPTIQPPPEPDTAQSPVTSSVVKPEYGPPGADVGQIEVARAVPPSCRVVA